MSLQFAKIDASAGDNVIVSGADFPQKRIRVLSYTVLGDTDCTLQWKSDGATTTDLSGVMPIAAKGGMHCTSNYLAPGGPMALLSTTNVEEDLVLNVSAGTVGGFITYYAISG